MIWRTIGNVSYDTWHSVITAAGGPDDLASEAAYNAARPHSALVLACAGRECRWGTTENLNTLANMNVLNLKMPLEADGTRLPGFMAFVTWAAGIASAVRRITSTTYGNGIYVPTQTVHDLISVFAPASENDVEAYVDFVESLIAGWTTSPTIPGGTRVPLYYTDIPGLPGGQLKTDYPITIKMIPEWRTTNRPGYKARSPRYSVQHGNGNPNSSAAGEATYLFNGAEGRQASYHSAADDLGVWIMVPADEVTWQAADGNGPGNYNGYSCEMVEDTALWANPARRDKAIYITADFMGRVAARLKIEKPQQHWDFNYMLPPSLRHDCPNKLRYTKIGGKLAWDIYVAQWYASKADELLRMAGNETPTPTPLPKPIPVYAKPIIDWMGDDLDKGVPSDHKVTFEIDGEKVVVQILGAEREYEVVKSTWRYQMPQSGGPKVGARLNVREKFTGSYIATVGKTRWVVTRYGSWILAGYLTPRVSVRAA